MNRSFTVEEIRELMDKPANIRNMSVIAHGKLDEDKIYMQGLMKIQQWITENLP